MCMELSEIFILVFLILVLKVVLFQKYANGGGGEVEVTIGVCVASHRFRIAIFQIKND